MYKYRQPAAVVAAQGRPRLLTAVLAQLPAESLTKFTALNGPVSAAVAVTIVISFLPEPHT
jgi:hypothetical protein